MSDDPGLSPEQWAFLAQFSANYVAGRKFACMAARAIVALGMLAGAISGLILLYHNIPNFR